MAGSYHSKRDTLRIIMLILEPTFFIWVCMGFIMVGQLLKFLWLCHPID
jgi:hypothetical protein